MAILLAAWVLVDALSKHTAPRGWASLIVVVLFMGALQLISLGIVGEYIRLIFWESKGRPPYILRAYHPAAILDPLPPTRNVESELPMQLQIGDRLSDETGEWEVIGSPYTMAGGKDARVRVQRVGKPGGTAIRIWRAHERVSVKRA